MAGRYVLFLLLLREQLLPQDVAVPGVPVELAPGGGSGGRPLSADWRVAAARQR